MNTNKRLLLVEDDATLAGSLTKALRGEGYTVDHAAAGNDGLRLAHGQSYGLVLTDLRLPGLGGMELVERLHESHPQVPVILFTAHGTAETAIKATKQGAYDYLLKPFSIPDLLAMIERGLEQHRSSRCPAPPGQKVAGVTPMIGRSRTMQEVFKDIGRFAPQNVTVLIRGETGTGKELIARAIWQHSGREKKPFVAINCAAIPDTLLESELFGHEKGSFTDAHSRRIGRFEQADGGTIFLDEIGDVSPATQVRLLRVLQEGCIQRVGGSETIPIDVRVLVATHRNLEEEVSRGTFRDDLYFRVSVVQLRVPPLRERVDDIPLLADHFARQYTSQFKMSFGGFQPGAIKQFSRHVWPGNVRELENVVRWLLLTARGFPVTAAMAGEALAKSIVSPADNDSPTLTFLAGNVVREAARTGTGAAHATFIAAAEAELLQQALTLANGNQSQAARWLGLSRLTLREKLHRHGLHPKDDHRQPGSSS